jgi:putative transposase
MLSDSKYKELRDFAVSLNNHKNTVSKEVCSDLSFYMEMNIFNFLKYIRNKYKGIINSNFDKQLYQDVFVSYENKFNAIQRNIIFEKVTFKGFEYYKRDTKDKKKGDFKKVIIKKEKTNLSSVLTYLARYGNENIVEYITNKLKKNDLTIDKINYYQNILNYINKFGFDRLFLLSLQRRNRILEKYSEHPIEFTKLTFRGRSRLQKQDIISYNDNYNSKINAFINISWLGRGNKLIIPVKYSKHYHGLMIEYKKPTPDVEYLISFTDKGKIKINICKDNERFIPENKVNYCGIDVNVKHNLFSLSDDSKFDYDRNLLSKLTNELSAIDNLKKNKEYVVGKKKQRKINSIRNKIQKSNEKICSNVCKYLNSIGLDHIVMEDLDNSFGKSFVNDKTSGLNFNRITKELNLSSLKQMIEHIARNYDISVSTVHASYTSKMCPICGCIEDENRKNQETFECVECSHKDNADHNASINIKNRVSSTVLRMYLLKQNKLGNGTYEPKVLKREKVKEVLLSFRQNLARDKDITRVDTFDYI